MPLLPLPLLLLLLTGAAAQTCAPLTPPPGLCDGYIVWPSGVYLAPGQTAEEAFANAAGLLELLPLETPECQAMIAPIFCAMALPSCIPNPSPAPSYPCLDTCQQYLGGQALLLGRCPIVNTMLSSSSIGDFCENSPFVDAEPTRCNDFVETQIATPPDNAVVYPQVPLPVCSSGETSACSAVSTLGTESRPVYDDAFEYWIPPGYSLETLEADVVAATFAIPLLQAVPNTEECAEALTLLACSSAFRPCEVTQIIKETMLGRLQAQVGMPVASPCVNMCTRANTACTLVFLGLGLPPLDCEEIDPLTGIPVFIPETPDGEDYVGNILGFQAPLPCVDSSITYKTDPVPCIEPLILDPAKAPVCQAPCISAAYSRADWDMMSDALLGLSIASLIGSAFVILTHVVFYKVKKRFPAVLALHLAICSFGIALTLLSVMATGYEAVFCKSATELGRMEGVCGFQSFAFHYFGLAISHWFLLLSISLYQMVVKEDSKWCENNQYLFNSVGWGLPMVFCLIAVAIDEYGYSEGRLWCFFRNSHESVWEWVLFYIPLSIILPTCSYLIVRVCIHIFRVSSAMGRSRNKTQIRLLFMAIFTDYVYASVYAVNVEAVLRTDAWTRSFEDFVACRGLGALDGSADECVVADSPSRDTWILAGVNVGMQGCLVFLVLGLTSENLKLWKRLLTGNLASNYDSDYSRKNSELVSTYRS